MHARFYVQDPEIGQTVREDRPINLESWVYALLAPDATNGPIASEHFDALEAISK
jgi:hypothetical protein